MRFSFFFILKTVYCVFSLESPQWGDFNENTQHTFMLQKIKEILIKPPDLALSSTLIGSNYPCFKLIFMVSKVFEPLKFDCTLSENELYVRENHKFILNKFQVGEIGGATGAQHTLLPTVSTIVGNSIVALVTDIYDTIGTNYCA